MFKRRHNVTIRPAKMAAYRISVKGCGTPGSAHCCLWDTTGGEWEDVSSQHMTGDADIRGEVIITGMVHDLVDGRRYQLETRFTCCDGREYGSDIVIAVKA